MKTAYNNLSADGAAHGSLTASSAKKAYDKVSYAKADSQASLGDDYKSYRLYNHVKNSRSGVKKYSWESVAAEKGKKSTSTILEPSPMVMTGTELPSQQTMVPRSTGSTKKHLI